MRNIVKANTRTMAILLAAMFGLLVAVPAANGETLKLEAQLLWGTNDAKSPDRTHKPVDPDIAKRLHELPLKWTNYFVVNSKRFEISGTNPKRISLSDKCEIEVKNLGQSMVEVSHFGQGKRTWRGTQALPEGEALVLAGNAPSSTSWLVVLKRIK